MDRLAVAAAPRAFNYGLARSPVSDWTHVMKLDGDIELPPDYFERLIAAVRRRPHARDGGRGASSSRAPAGW